MSTIAIHLACALVLALVLSGCADPRVVDPARIGQPAQIYVVATESASFTLRNVREERAHALGAGIGGVIGGGIAAAASPAIEGRKDVTTTTFPDPPLPRLKERVLSALASDPKLAGVQWTMVDGTSDRVPPGALSLMLKLEKWGVSSFDDDPDVYGPLVQATAKLLRGGDVLWKSECQPTGGRDAMPFTVGGMRNDPERLRAVMMRATDECADELAAGFAGRGDREEKVRLDKSSLGDVERVLVGTAAGPGLIRGIAPFDAEFRHLAIGTHQLAVVQKLVHESIAAVPGSELKLAGTFDGRPFEAKMERSRSGRVRVRFAGLRFATEAEVQAFLAPFEGPRFRKIEFTGDAGGRPLTLLREPKLD
ncbi:MAG: hypothetical protein HYU41_28485 [Candidatus Rokubacteria bacterium]|nr:hypothetical protein [Candidatus Rokubacteria bacterium]